MKKKEYFIRVDFSKYRGKYIAIIDRKVVASGGNAKKVWEEVKRKYPRRTPELTKVSKDGTLNILKDSNNYDKMFGMWSKNEN